MIITLRYKVFLDQFKDFFIPNHTHKIPITLKFYNQIFILTLKKNSPNITSALKLFNTSIIFFWGIIGRYLKKYMNMNNFYPPYNDLKIMLPHYLPKKIFFSFLQLFRRNAFLIFRNPEKIKIEFLGSKFFL